MSIYESLIKDHKQQRQLCEEIINTSSATQKRALLWKTLSIELEAHAAAEEQAFYSYLMQKPDGTRETRHAVHEHMQMTKLINELNDSDQGSAGWMKKFKDLQHKVIHHLDEEEKNIFPEAREIIADAKAQKLAEIFEHRKTQEQAKVKRKFT